MDLVSLEFQEVLVSDVRGGETLKHFRFQPGDVQPMVSPRRSRRLHGAGIDDQKP